jgi:integrase
MTRRAFGRVRQLPSGKWQARFTSPDGRQLSLGTYASRTAASRALSELEADVARGVWTARGDSSQTLGVYAATWMQSRELSPRTREHYGDQLRLRILPRLGDVPLAKLTPQRVREWHAALRAEAEASGRGLSALSTSYRVLRAILTTAVEDELIGRNPCSIRRASAQPSRERAVLQERDVWALAAAVPDRYRALVWLAAATALRSAELSALRRCDLDLLRREVRVGRAYIEPARSPAFFGPPKSAAGVRTVAIPQVVIPVLYEHLNQWAEPGAEGLLFTSEKGAPLSRHNRKWWRKAGPGRGARPANAPS